MSDASAQSRKRNAVIENALVPLGRLTSIHPDEHIHAAIAEVARCARSASGADKGLIRVRAIDLLATSRAEWTLDQRTEIVDAHLSRAGVVFAEEWELPIPLEAHTELPSFPLEALPSWWREWVEAEAQATQTPVDMAAMLALAVVATACQRLLIVRVRKGWTEPPCLYISIALPPGSRKSAVARDAREPLDTYEREQADRLAPEIARSQDVLAAAQKRHERAIAQAAKADGPTRSSAEANVRAARAELTAADDEMIVAPQLSCADCTQEALARLLSRNGECISLLDAEGCGPLAIMCGRYTDGSAAIDLYLRAHVGDLYRCDRVGREPIILRRPVLTIAVTMQPEVLRQLGERREMRGLGLLARFLWVTPQSTVGRRVSRPKLMPEHVRVAYAQYVRALLELRRAGANEPHVVQLSAAADDVIAAWSDRLEPRLGAGGDLEHVADWAGKLGGTIVRIAGVLHAAEHGECPWGIEISAETVRRAIRVGEYLLPHALAALSQMGVDPAVTDARYVLEWLLARDLRTIARRDLWHAMRGRYPRSEMIAPALAVLLEHGWIRIYEPRAARGPGRPPSPTIELSPLARRHRRPDHNDHNDQIAGVAAGIGHNGQSGHRVEDAEISL